MSTILVVDDRVLNREFLSSLLGYAGHRVLEAGDGLEALHLVRDENPDLVIADILMPTMDGVEFARRVATDADLAHVPIIFYTATYRLAEARQLAASCGVTTVIAKPSEPQVLLDAVQGELGLPRQVVEARRTSAVAARHPALAIERLCATTSHELEELCARLESTVAEDETPSSKARRLSRLSDDMDASVTRAQGLSMRLAALVELGLDLAEQSEAEPMLRMFCHAARDIMNANIAAVCTLQEDAKPQYLEIYGLPDSQARAVRRALNPVGGLFGELLRDGKPRRANQLGGNPLTLGLPSSHAAVENFLALPLKSSSRTYGWVYLANRLHGQDFSEEDEQLAATLVAQLLPEYENLALLDRLKRHSGLLEVEAEERRRAMERLAESELRFRQLAENVREVFFLVDAETDQLLYVSPAYEEVYDRSVESFYAQPQSWIDAVHPADRAEVLAALEKTRHEGLGQFDLGHRILRSDGSVRWINARGFPVRDDDGKLQRIAGITEDITDRKSQELRVRRLSRIHAVLSGINSAIVRIHERKELLDETCRIAVDEGGFRMVWIGMLETEASRLRPVAYRGFDAETLGELEAFLGRAAENSWGPAQEALRSGKTVARNVLRAETSQRIGPVARLAVQRGLGSLIALPLLPDNRPAGVIVLYADEPDFFDARETALLDELAGDVSFALKYMSKEEQLNYLAYYDSLTGLPNTALFHERLSQALATRPSRITAVVLVDLDRFTQLNDSLGRHIGDRLLNEVGRRLQASLVEPQLLARISSDTYAVAMSALRGETDAGSILHERILAALNRPFHIDEHELRITARAGIALYPSDAETTDGLFKNAEAALREAKTSGARYQFYSPRINARVAEDLAFEQKLLRAVEQQQFLVYYQPKVSARTGAFVGLEALVRWADPQKGLVAPNEFIPALEDTELILDVGRWVLGQAMLDCRRWREQGLPPLPIAVNVSPVQLRYADFPDTVTAAIADNAVSGTDLELEITESVIMADIEPNIELLRSVSATGVSIAIDDFGTGYSSLRYLAKLPVQTLKIDRSFVVSMTNDADSMTLVSTIIGLAHSFDLSVVAEGVDSEEQAKLLRLMKCDSMQGYLFGKPMPAADVEALLRRDSA